MRLGLITYLLILLTQCNPVSVDELRNESPVMMAIVPNGSETTGIQLFVLENNELSVKPIDNASVSIIHNATSNAGNLNYANGNYTSDFAIEPGQTYTLEGIVLEQPFSTEIAIPPAISFTIPFNDTLLINSNSSGSSIVIVTWTELNSEAYSYVVRLECLEETPVEIPFPVNSGNFATNFSGPQVAAGIIIADTDFRYYGLHKLRVFAIPKSLEKVYFYNAGDIRGLLTNGPDNILGIKGFAAGVSTIEADFFIQPQ